MEATASEGLVPPRVRDREAGHSAFVVVVGIEESRIPVPGCAVLHVGLGTPAQVLNLLRDCYRLLALGVGTEDDDEALGKALAPSGARTLHFAGIGEVILEGVVFLLLYEDAFADDPVILPGIGYGLFDRVAVVSGHEDALELHGHNVVEVLLGEVCPVEDVTCRGRACTDQLLPEQPERARVGQDTCKLHVVHGQAGGEAVDDHHVQLPRPVALLVAAPGHSSYAIGEARYGGGVHSEHRHPSPALAILSFLNLSISSCVMSCVWSVIELSLIPSV